VITKEDGVDEAGRTTQPPLIMAPPSLKADPDGEATDTIVDNGIMSSSRKRTGSSRSGASRRSGSANGESSASGDSAVSEDSVDAATSVDDATTSVDDASADAADEGTTEAGSSTEVPLPAETIGKAKGRSADSSGSAGANGRGSERQGSRQMSSGDSGWLTSQQTEPAPEAESADSASPAESVAAVENGTSAAKSDRKPAFTPSAAASAGTVSASAASRTTSTPTAAPTGASPSYSGTGSSRQDTAYSSRSGYSTSAPPTATSPTTAPAGGAGAPSARNGYSSSNGFSSGATAVGGAAAGLASSVTSAWQRRGSARNIQTRKSTKRQAMLTLARVEPWSVMKFSFVASVVAFIILFVAVAVLYMVLSALGVFDSLQHTVSSITSSQSSTGTNISHWFSASLILGYTAMLGALNIVLITAMSTVGSVIYNLIAKTIGGIEVTLRETD
jgi:Transmembrane domain of unknown function (DUF3566)